MDIELKHKVLRDRFFNSGLAKLSQFGGFPTKQLYNVSRILEKVRQADRASEVAWKQMIAPFIQKDEKGQIIPETREDGTPIPNSFSIAEEKKGEFQKAVDDFNEKAFVVGKRKIALSDLEGVGLSANELLALEPLIHGLEIVEGEAAHGDQKEDEVQSQKEQGH